MALPDRVSCLARISPGAVQLLSASIERAGSSAPVIVSHLSVTELGLLAPSLLVVDVDGLDVDPLEMLRRLRFVLPACVLAVYTDVLEEPWALACHMAGASCLLSKSSDATQVAAGLRRSLISGCFTDPSFGAA
jgi:DNA-binding NarL/FixJ family response regulator